MIHWLLHVLGLDSPAGWTYLAWSGVVGSGLLGFLGQHFHRKMDRHHAAAAAQAERHHAERQALATAHHTERLHQAERHHDQALAQGAAHHEAMKAHVTAHGITALQEAVKRAPRSAPRPKGGD